eukprot:2938018-Pleurochrysis_carterae.AAC.1
MVDPDDPDNKVCVLYKTNLTDRATNTQAEFKPLLPAAAGTTQKATNPVGLKFMLRVPELDKDPGVELWKGVVNENGNENDKKADESCWNRKKVETDVLESAQVHGFSPEE